MKINKKTITAIFSLSAVFAISASAQAQSSSGKQTGLTNPGFEEPRGKAASFAFVKTMPGWKTTDKEFEIWGSGFEKVAAYEGAQFVELNAWIDGTLYQDSTGIKPGSVLEFTFAHRGRSGKDTMKLTITDLGADNSLAGGDDKVLFTKEYTTGKDAWAVYDSTKEKQIKALGNTVRFAYEAISSAGGSIGAGNFLDAANFGIGVVSMELAKKPEDLSGEYVISAKAVAGDYLAIWTYGNIVSYIGAEQTWTLKKLSEKGETRIYSLEQKGQYLSVKDGKLVPSKTPGQWAVWDNGGAYSIAWYEDDTKGANCLSLIKKGNGYANFGGGHAHYTLELARNNAGGTGNAHQLWELTKKTQLTVKPVAAPAKMVSAGHSKTSNMDAGEHILTQDLNDQNGAVWSASKVSFSENFKIRAEIYLGTKDAGADGLALVFQAKDNSIVSKGGGIGYQGISPSIAIEFDTYHNGDKTPKQAVNVNNHDPVEDHVGLRTDGDPVHKASDSVEVGNLEDGKYHPITFEWNARQQTFNLSLDGKQIFKERSIPKTGLAGQQVYFGFTAATGGLSNEHKVRSISFVSE